MATCLFKASESEFTSKLQGSLPALQVKTGTSLVSQVLFRLEIEHFLTVFSGQLTTLAGNFGAPLIGASSSKMQLYGKLENR